MTDAVIFGFGILVTTMCATAIVMLVRAAYLDGSYGREQQLHAGRGVAAGESEAILTDADAHAQPIRP